MKKQNETDNQRHESTIDKYFDRTADGIFQDMKRDEFIRSLILTAAREFLMDK